MAGNIDTIIIDTSALMSFLMPDEKHSKEIQNIFDELAVYNVEVIAPQLLLYEVGNTLKTGILRKRINKKQANFIAERFLELGIDFYEVEVQKVLNISVKYDLSFYDASYVYLARKMKADLLSFDGNLMELSRL